MPIVQVRDIEMHYRVHGRVDGEPLVLLHGFTGTGGMYDPILDQLSERYRLYVPDMRGHGRTTNPKGEIIHAELSHDTAAFTEAMGLDRAHFCGFSTGGMQLTFLALEQPQLVHSLTFTGATYTFDDHVKSRARALAASPPSPWLDSLKAMHGEVHGQAYATTIIQLWLDSVLRPDELPFTPDDLRRISRPALIVNGDRDPFFPMRVPLTMYEAIPDAELCIMPNCAHSLGDESPTIFVTALLQFLAKHPMA